jgi:chromosome partitioning protein
MSKTKTICFANNKGGSGKSTTCANVAYQMAQEGKRVLLIDGDMQLNLTLSFFPEDEALGFVQSGDNLYTAIKDQKSLAGFIVHTSYEGVDLIPSNISLSEYEPRPAGVFMREKILANGIEAIKDDYDYVLIDCSPTLGILTINAIVAADEILIPVQPQYLPAIGMTQLVRTIEEVRTNMKPDLKYSGIVFTLVNMQTNIAK